MIVWVNKQAQDLSKNSDQIDKIDGDMSNGLLEEIKEQSDHQIEEFGEWEILDFPDEQKVNKKAILE